MEFIDKDLQSYCDRHTSPESAVLSGINRDTHANVLQPRMLSGHFQGRLLAMLSKLHKPKVILEIGTYTAYSAICLAEGLAPDGQLITIDVNVELEDRIRQAIKNAGMEDRIRFIVGDALNVIKALDLRFDLVFIDADKENYSRYYDLVIDRMNEGGLIIADNVLWSGKVINEAELSKDKDTRALDEFNRKVQADMRVENVLLPVRDGLMIVRRS
jgi:caffeoyl-CoA O-methyltransferase